MYTFNSNTNAIGLKELHQAHIDTYVRPYNHTTVTLLGTEFCSFLWLSTMHYRTALLVYCSHITWPQLNVNPANSPDVSSSGTIP